jgi:multidrug efflux pump subunit AcrA (membrane-fusion protein)
VQERTAPPPNNSGNGNKDSQKPADPGDSKPYLVAVKQRVEIGYVNSTHVEILSGVKPGDLVVITGLSTLKDGTRITTVVK